MAFNILLVEDNYGDVVLFQEVLKHIDINLSLKYFRDGHEAMLYLNKQGKYKEALTPDLIYLDLNLPKKSGKEVLIELRKDDKTKHIPVVILTTSKHENDVFESYLLGANSYMNKCPEFDAFVESIRASVKFFLLNNGNLLH